MSIMSAVLKANTGQSRELSDTWTIYSLSWCTTSRRVHPEAHRMLCVKATLQLHQCQVVYCDIPEPQPASIIQEGPGERVGVQRV